MEFGAQRLSRSPTGLSQVQDMGLQVFHAGTSLKDGGVVASGGRVLTVTAVRPSLEAALAAANQGVAAVGFPGAAYRRDIGHRAIAHLARCRCVCVKGTKLFLELSASRRNIKTVSPTEG